MVVVTIGQYSHCVWLLRMLICYGKFAFHALQILNAFSGLMGVEMLAIWFKVQTSVPSQKFLIADCVRFAKRLKLQR